MTDTPQSSSTGRTDLLYVKIQTPDKVVWEGASEAVSSKNKDGPFDILPDHANIITLIENNPISVITGSVAKDYTFERAILTVEDNRVTIFGDIEVKDANKSSED